MKKILISLLLLCAMCSFSVFASADGMPASKPDGMPPEMNGDMAVPNAGNMGFGGWNEQAWQALRENGVITEETLNAVTEYFTEKTEEAGGFAPDMDGTEPPEKPDGEQNGMNGGEPPEMNGDMQLGQGTQPPENPDGEQDGLTMTPPEGFNANGDGTEPPEMPEGGEYMGITTELLDELLENGVITQEIQDAIAAVIPEMTEPRQK